MMNRQYSLTAQITEVDYELKMRARVYSHQVVIRKMSQGEADYHTACMEAVRASLVWLRDHDAAVKAAVKAEGEGS